MGLRFRKSIKLAPGIRMNFSKSGASWTIGPRGASVGIGRRGAYLNAGIPGTGIYSREKVSSAPSMTSSRMQISVSINDEGVLCFNDSDGNLLSEATIELAKKQQGDKIRGLIQQKCDEINGQIAALGEIHVHTPPPTFKRDVQDDFSVPRPSMPILRSVGFWGKLFRSYADKVDAENSLLLRRHQLAVADWEKQKSNFVALQKAKEELLGLVSAGEELAMGKYLEIVLQEIIWPRETLVNFEFKNSGTVVLDVDLPEIEEMPDKTAAVPQRGLKLSVKELSGTQIQKLYMRHIHGVGFRIVGETFAALPKINSVVLSAYSQRANTATAQVGDEYLYSVRIPRGEWAKIKFDNLSQLDPIQAFAGFELRREMSKTGIFKPIQPFAE